MTRDLYCNLKMKLTLYHTKPKEEYSPHIGALKSDLFDLEHNGKIESYQLMSANSGSPRVDNPRRGGIGRQTTERFEEYQAWASRENLQLGAGFQDRTEIDYIEFPELFLEVKKDRELRGVFPCVEKSEGDLHEYEIEDYIEALKSGEDWRTHRSDRPTRLSYTEHDAIQAYLQNHMEEISSNWTHFATEYSLANTQRTARNARVDLVFEHKHESERYLLVEVKPDRESVDEAFGQLLRYQYAFCDVHSTPNLTPNQIELAVAAPEIEKYHKQAANELGIKILEQVSH